MPMVRRQAASGAHPENRAGRDARSLGTGLLAAGAVYLAAAFLISEPEGGYAAVGPRVFPIVIGCTLVAVALWLALRGSKTGASATPRAPAAPTVSAAGALAAPDADWRTAAPSALLFLGYIVLLEPLGYLPATTAFIALESRLLGSRRWRRDLLAALAVAASVYTLFSLLLGLRLPAGFLGGP